MPSANRLFLVSHAIYGGFTGWDRLMAAENVSRSVIVSRSGIGYSSRILRARWLQRMNSPVTDGERG